MPHNKKLKAWIIAATSAEIRDLVDAVGTSRQYLYQLSTGNRVASPDLAGRIETISDDIGRKSRGRLPKLTRADLAPACAQCPYARKCSNKKGR